MKTTPKPFAFVLMPFESAFLDTYLLGIKPACQDAGYYCERLDEQIFEETMLERIYNQIAKADLVIADLTGRNANVFYETGYAHALGKRVILLTRNADDIPFDLKHHFHIIYSDGIASLKDRLRDRAAYYLTHPDTTTHNPFDQIVLLLNGNLIDYRAGCVPLNIPIKSLAPDSEASHAVCIEVAFHLLDSEADVCLDIDVRLITTALFPRSGYEISYGSSQIYTTITMPNGGIMHKPLDHIRISPSDPDRIIFELYPKGKDILGDAHEMTLRLISSGLRHDIPLKVAPL